MCSACGILQNGVDWVEGVGGGDVPPHDRLAYRRQRLQLVNLMLEGSGVQLTEHGRQLVVRSATGATRVVTSLAHVWLAADEIGSHLADPLDLCAPLFASEEP